MLTANGVHNGRKALDLQESKLTIRRKYNNSSAPAYIFPEHITRKANNMCNKRDTVRIHPQPNLLVYTNADPTPRLFLNLFLNTTTASRIKSDVSYGLLTRGE